MTTNSTHIISIIATASTLSAVNGAVKTYIALAISQGYINLDIKPMVILPEYLGGVPTNKYLYSVQVNYYDPSLYE